MDNENSKCVSLDVNGALEMLSKLQFERLKARMAGDDEKETNMNNEMNRLLEALDSALKNK